MMGKRVADARAMKGTQAQRREKTTSNRKADTAKARILFNGWNLPFIPDENDIVAWIKREKSGENKKKPRHEEEVPEEAYRHMFSRCCNLENQMEFERESLIQRYRKNCQVGPLLSEKSRAPPTERPSTIAPLDRERIPSTPSRALRYPRSCKSAEVPGTPKISTLQQIGLGDEELESLIPTRSHSVIDDSKLRAYGLTLPPDEKTARLLELAGKFIARADRANTVAAASSKTEDSNSRPDGATAEDMLDEGYDSKISSNTDAEAGEEDVEEEDDGTSRVAQLDTASEKTNLESALIDAQENGLGGGAHTDSSEISGWTESCSRVPAPGDPAHIINSQNPFGGGSRQTGRARVFPQYQAPVDPGRAAIAKLIYSQRDRNLYERAPSRRMRQNGFRYAGKEQSRLMETSLNYITPSYLSMHHIASMSQYAHYPTLSMQDVSLQQNNHHHNHHQNEAHQTSGHTLQDHQQEYRDSHQSQEETITNVTSSTTTAQLTSRTLTMRKICLQDSNSRDMSHNHLHGSHNNNFSLEAKANSSTGERSNANSPDQNSSTNPPHDNDKNTSNSHGIRRKKTPTPTDAGGVILTPKAILSSHAYESNKDTDTFGDILSSNQGDQSAPQSASRRNRDLRTSGNASTHAQDYLSGAAVTSQRRTSQTTIPGFRPGRTNPGVGGLRSDQRMSTTCFPVADLLPAVEKSLRRKAHRGLSRHHQQLLYRSQTTLMDSPMWRQSEQPVMTSYPDSLTYSSAPALCGLSGSDVIAEEEAARAQKLHMHAGESILRGGGGMSLLVQAKSQGPPGFRPHHSLSPLQRAKDIVNRRLHGHITQLPDGSETVQVTSPQYQSSRLDRINSASKRLARVINGTWKDVS